MSMTYDLTISKKEDIAKFITFNGGKHLFCVEFNKLE